MLARPAKKPTNLSGVFHFPGKKKERLVQIQKPAFHAWVRTVQVKTLLFAVTSAIKAVWLSVKTFVGVLIIYDLLRLKTSFSLNFSLQKHTHTHTKSHSVSSF